MDEFGRAQFDLPGCAPDAAFDSLEIMGWERRRSAKGSQVVMFPTSKFEADEPPMLAAFKRKLQELSSGEAIEEKVLLQGVPEKWASSLTMLSGALAEVD